VRARTAAAVACAILTGPGCTEDPLDPWIVTAGGAGPYRTGTELGVLVEDACRDGEGRDFDGRVDCADNFIRTVRFDSSEAFAIVDPIPGIGPAGVLELSFSVRAIAETDELCVEINGYDDECAYVPVREPNEAHLSPQCAPGAEAPFVVPVGSEVVVLSEAYRDGEPLSPPSSFDVGVDPGAFEALGNSRYRAPATPGPTAITESLGGTRVAFEIVDPIADGWQLGAEIVGGGTIHWTLVTPGYVPCVAPTVTAAVLTPETCDLGQGQLGPIAVEPSLYAHRSAPGTCTVELSLLGPDGSAQITTAVDLDAWHTAFVTSTEFDGDLDGLTGADILCTNLATAAGRTEPGWRAVLSDATALAVVRVGLRGPVFDIDGELLVTEPNQFFGPNIALVLSETGEDLTGWEVWTGTHINGNAGSDCENWNTDSLFDHAVAGVVGGTGGEWLDTATRLCSGDRRLYCVSQLPGASQ
jgi:hypothetical protein